jgi:hypothetical protein
MSQTVEAVIENGNEITIRLDPVWSCLPTEHQREEGLGRSCR